MKIIGSDFDGTIHYERVILDSTREKIKRFRSAGNLFVIVTGRSFTSFQKAIAQYKIDFYDYVICANGALIADAKLNILQQHHMDTLIARNVIHMLFQDNNKKGIFVNTLSNSIQIYHESDIANIVDSIISISVSFETLAQRKAFSLDSFNDVSVYSNTIYMDFMPRGISKATAIDSLFQDLNGTKLYTIGDGENDVVMLENRKHSYTFSRTEESIQKSAYYMFDTIDEILDDIYYDPY